MSVTFCGLGMGSVSARCIACRDFVKNMQCGKGQRQALFR